MRFLHSMIRSADLDATLDVCPELCAMLMGALEDECPLTSRDGGFIRKGYDEQLDELRQLASGGKEWIAKYQAGLSETSGISNLKVGFNKVLSWLGLGGEPVEGQRTPSEVVGYLV